MKLCWCIFIEFKLKTRDFYARAQAARAASTSLYFCSAFFSNLRNYTHKVLESAAHRAPLASAARKIASASASGARKKNNERERRSEKSESAGDERRSSNLRK